MIRGCKRSVIQMRATDSEIFDQVFFIMRDGSASACSERDMVKEADRLISGSKNIPHTKKSRTRIFVLAAAALLCYGAGLLCGLLL